MKKKLLFIPALVLGLVAGAGAAVALAKPQKAEVARAETAPWAIADNTYEVAMLESYSHHDHPFDHSKYVFGDWLYGNGEQHNITTDLKMHAITETPNTWRFNLTKGYLKGVTTRYTTLLRASNSSGTYSICNTSEYTEADNPDEYAIGQLLAGKSMTYGGAMISTNAYEDIRDISFFWRYTEAERIYICYKIGDAEWKILDGTSSINGNYTGTRGWDAHGYTTFNSGSWTSKELYGATARLALVVAGTGACDVQLGGLVINASRAAVRYLNAMTYHDNICDNASDIDLHKGESDSACNQYSFQLATEHADGAFLNEYSVVGTKTQHTNALEFYNYLVAKIPELGSAKAPSSQMMLVKSNSSNIIAIVCISTSVVAIAAGGLLIGLKKKKHQ